MKGWLKWFNSFSDLDICLEMETKALPGHAVSKKKATHKKCTMGDDGWHTIKLWRMDGIVFAFWSY